MPTIDGVTSVCRSALSQQLRYIPALDGVRAIAAFMVMVFHWFQLSTDRNGHVFQQLSRYAVFGQTGVDLFFVLSGFLITRIILKTRDHHAYFRNFYARRALRIFPLYYGFLFVFFCLIPPEPAAQTAPNGLLWYCFYLQNIQSTFGSVPVYGPGHFWSLAIEEHFYLIWPVLIFFVNLRRVPLIIVMMLIVAIGSRALLLAMGEGVFYFTLCRLDGLATGCFLAWLEFSKGDLARYRNRMLLILLLIVPILGVSWFYTGGHGLAIVQITKFTLLGIAYAAVVGLVVGLPNSNMISAGLASLPFAWLGAISYGLYVFHPVCFGFTNKLVSNGGVSLVVGVAATVAIASLSYMIFEKRFLALKKFFVR
ncbi:MAG: hypothetical protein QOI07_3140 [Verrucomicrobiota bacterium]|jgi:peptidoglycan/LPS O-acetylase OafA/YrhL